MSFKNLISVLVIQILLLFGIATNKTYFEDAYLVELKTFYKYLVSHNVNKDDLQKSIDAFNKINDEILKATTNKGELSDEK